MIINQLRMILNNVILNMNHKNNLIQHHAIEPFFLGINIKVHSN
jgi:hypothetical protein